jgi:hypothetical protein
MDEQILELQFPALGIDQSMDLAEQRPQTCVTGTNVRLFEPTSLRARGGSRPGTSKYVTTQLGGGSNRVQMLNLIVYADYAYLPPSVPPGNPPTIPDPSSFGPPSSWGTGTLYLDPNTGNPVTGATIGTRAPGGGTPYGPPNRPQRGNGVQPNKNILTGSPPAPVPGVCFQGQITFRINNPPPDPFGYNGQIQSFVGIGCVAPGALTPVGGGNFIPTTAGVVPFGRTDSVGGTPGMLLLTYCKLWLAVKVGSSSSGTVTIDLVSPASSTGCTQGQSCSAAPPSTVPPASSVGTTFAAS